MLCPRCQTALEEIDRSGITVDRCASCRGIWLDRGELEKVLAREVAAEPGAYARAPMYPPERPRYAYEDREPPSSDRRGHYGHHGHHGHKKHRSFWHELFD